MAMPDANVYPPTNPQAVPAADASGSNWFSNNADWLTAAAGQLSQYEQQKTANEAQSHINQAAAKWSGFNPSLMNMVKAPKQFNPVGAAYNVLKDAPSNWYNIQKLYDARKAAQSGDKSKMEEIQKENEQSKILAAALANSATTRGLTYGGF